VAGIISAIGAVISALGTTFVLIYVTIIKKATDGMATAARTEIREKDTEARHVAEVTDLKTEMAQVKADADIAEALKTKPPV
jgi:coenzyme F420-reducing hydrogenase beta subunit